MDRSSFIGSGGYPMSYREPERGVHGRVPYTEQQDRLAFSIESTSLWLEIISSLIVVRRCFHLISITLVLLLRLYERYISSVCCQRPYHVESTGSRPITEVKQRRARLVLGWVTAWEHRVLLAFFFFFFPLLTEISVGFAVDPNVIKEIILKGQKRKEKKKATLTRFKKKKKASSDVLTFSFFRFAFNWCYWQPFFLSFALSFFSPPLY